jgi:hypothetical protein
MNMSSTPIVDDALLMTLISAISHGDPVRASELVAAYPALASARLYTGASRQAAKPYFLDEIGHYVYAGDTGLHIAAAAYEVDLVRALAAAGATVHAANRRGAQPLHYAVDGFPGSAKWNPDAQAQTVRCLVELGADPSAVDKNGSAPLHRAVRNRCAPAVQALLDAGADPHLANRSGSRPVDLARWTTGRGGSGSEAARQQQQEILLLLEPSARGRVDSMVGERSPPTFGASAPRHYSRQSTT